MKTALTILSVAAALCLTTPSGAAERVDLELVLAADVSRSVNSDEYRLQRQGYAAALTDPRVLQAIQSGPYRSIALTYVEWSGADEQAVIADWTVLRDEASTNAVAAQILAAQRPFLGRTSISQAIDFAVTSFARSGVEAERRAIDVSGDGTNNAGRLVSTARDDAVAQGITINGLAIINEHPENVYVLQHVQPPEGLPEYYRQNVIGGPGSFLLVVEGFDTFAEAIVRKLITEIAARDPAAILAEAPQITPASRNAATSSSESPSLPR
jgi:Protein of unknown function (DUF1194)